MTHNDIASLIEQVAPLQLQEHYDNAGWQLGDPEQETSAIVTTLDVTEETIQLAADQGANLIVSHHPLLFHGVKQINPRRDYVSRTIIEAIRHDIAIYSAHTNLDNAPQGVNRRIGEVLGLTDVRPLAPLATTQTAGLPADFVKQCGSGIVGKLPAPMSAYDFAQVVKQLFHIDALVTNAADVDIQREIRVVALCGGAGDDFIADAVRCGADAFLTGEVGYHFYFGHPEIFIMCGGHYETEQFTADLLRDLIGRKYPDLKVVVAPKSAPTATII